jgi:hypothetical protein
MVFLGGEHGLERAGWNAFALHNSIVDSPEDDIVASGIEYFLKMAGRHA